MPHSKKTPRNNKRQEHNTFSSNSWNQNYTFHVKYRIKIVESHWILLLKLNLTFGKGKPILNSFGLVISWNNLKTTLKLFYRLKNTCRSSALATVWLEHFSTIKHDESSQAHNIPNAHGWQDYTSQWFANRNTNNNISTIVCQMPFNLRSKDGSGNSKPRKGKPRKSDMELQQLQKDKEKTS